MAFGYKNTDPNWSDILSTTFNNVHAKWVDDIFQARPLAFFLMREGQVVPIDGGVKIQESIVGAENPNAGSYSGSDTLAIAESEEFTSALFDWKQHSTAVTVTGLDEIQNSGDAAFLDLLASKIDVAKESATASLNTMFHGDGTGNAGKDMDGLQNLVAQNATAVGGIDPSDGDNTWWQSQLHDATNAAAFSHTNSTVLDRLMVTNVFNDASVGGDTPKFGLTTQELHEFYESLLQQNVRHTDSMLADAGFQAIEAKGKPIVYDDETPAGYFYWLNPKYLKLKVHRNRFFKAGPFIQPNDQDIRTMKLLTAGNLTISSRRRQGVITGLTTS